MIATRQSPLIFSNVFVDNDSNVNSNTYLNLITHKNMSSPKSTSIANILHENNQHAARNRSFFVWMPVNLILLSLILRDIWKYRRGNKFIFIAEHFLAVILVLNILYLCCSRFLNQYFPKKYNISLQQLNLLKNFNVKIAEESNLNVISDQSDKNDQRKNRISFEQFRTSMSPMGNNSTCSVKTEFPNDNFKSEKFSAKHFSSSSPISFSEGTPIISEFSHDSSILHTSGDSFLGFPMNCDSYSNPSLNASNLSRSFIGFAEDDYIDEVDSMSRSVDHTAAFRYAQNTNGTADARGDWKPKGSIFYRPHTVQRSDLMLNDVYQLSSVATFESVKPVNEVSSLGANTKICKKFGIHPAYLPEWIANLRMWISQTILTRIIREIKEVNSSLTLYGATNVSIGSSGIERLKKAAAMSHISQNIPSLSSLISFLDISTYQEYVVQRIGALATGSMSNYCWNSGGTYEGKPWNESLPTDAALVMHLVAAYFDSQLFPLPHTAPDGRQFSSAHFFKTPATPLKNKKSLIIYQQRMNPPHFQLIVGEETYDISRGRNNLFHVLLFFLQHIKTKESGIFEHVNFGSSGINMLWIINEPSHKLYKKL